MKIICKDGLEHEVDPTWVKEWNEVYYEVDAAILKARLWCLDNPQKRKTKRGMRAFLGAWIRRDCKLRPTIRQAQIVHEEKPVVPIESRRDWLQQMKSQLEKS